MKTERFDKIIGWTNEWVRFIRGMTKNPIVHNPDLPLEYKLRVLDEDEGELNEGDVVLNLVMETLDAAFIWSKNTGMVTFKARDAYDLSWEGFLFYGKCLEDFASKVKEQ